MIHRTLGILIICLFLLLPSNIYSASIKEDYELQERCGKRCEEMFKKLYGNGYNTDKDGNWMYSYQNHYNRKLNKCFILVTSTHYPNDKKYGIFSLKEVFDINENKSYGTFSRYSKNVTGMECKVLEKICQSGEEWDLLVKPYMEE